MNWRDPSLPPLLRGLGTLLVVVVGIVVGVAENRQRAQMAAETAQARERVESEAALALAERRTDALTHEVQLLRLQLRDGDLADDVFENVWFQVLGALGTLLIAASFFIEARQKRPAPALPPDPPRP